MDFMGALSKLALTDRRAKPTEMFPQLLTSVVMYSILTLVLGISVSVLVELNIVICNSIIFIC